MGSFAAHPPKKGYEMGRDKGGEGGWKGEGEEGILKGESF